MSEYHPRRPEKMISRQEELFEIIRGQKFMTLALCRDTEPYLVTVNYAFDPAENCFYFHCSPSGKKVDYLRANPKVWGQILEDRGYLHGACNHAYRTVQFNGYARFLENPEEKRRALCLMIEQLESDPLPVKKRFIEGSNLQNVAVCRVQVENMSGKKNGLES